MKTLLRKLTDVLAALRVMIGASAAAPWCPMRGGAADANRDLDHLKPA